MASGPTSLSAYIVFLSWRLPEWVNSLYRLYPDGCPLEISWKTETCSRLLGAQPTQACLDN